MWLLLVALLATPTDDEPPWTSAGWRPRPAELVTLTVDAMPAGHRITLTLDRAEAIRIAVARPRPDRLRLDLDRLRPAPRFAPPPGSALHLEWLAPERARLDIPIHPRAEYALRLTPSGVTLDTATRLAEPTPPTDAPNDPLTATQQDPLEAAGEALIAERYADAWHLLATDRAPERADRNAWFRAEALRKADLPLLALEDYLEVLLTSREPFRIDEAIDRIDGIHARLPGAISLIAPRLADGLPIDPEARAWWILRRAQDAMATRLVLADGIIERTRQLARAAEMLLALAGNPRWAPRARLIIAAIAAELGDPADAEVHARALDEQLPPGHLRDIARLMRARLAYARPQRAAEAEARFRALLTAPATRAGAEHGLWWLAWRRDPTPTGGARALAALLPLELDGQWFGPTEQLAAIYAHHCLADRLRALVIAVRQMEPHDPLTAAFALERARLDDPEWSALPALLDRRRRMHAALMARRSVVLHERNIWLDRLEYDATAAELAGATAIGGAFGVADGTWHDTLAASAAVPDLCPVTGDEAEIKLRNPPAASVSEHP